MRARRLSRWHIEPARAITKMIGTIITRPTSKKSGRPAAKPAANSLASTLVLLKLHGTLEKRLAPLGIAVKWTEFPAGPQLLEGLNVGAIDFGYVGEAPRCSRRLPARTSSTPLTKFRRRTPKASSCIRMRRSKHWPI